ADANHGLPNKCACGKSIAVETGEQGRRYYLWKVLRMMARTFTSDVFKHSKMR
ncbi:hypothetical protein IGI04_002891, partial [Brassica rapa subsp. trilocularis]